MQLAFLLTAATVTPRIYVRCQWLVGLQMNFRFRC